MFLEKISVLNFKNLAEVELDFSANVNCFVGDNAAGKTNLLDAIYYLSMSKSSVGLTDGQSVRHGADFFMLDARYASETESGAGVERREHVVCSYKRGPWRGAEAAGGGGSGGAGGKVIKRNGKEYDRLSEHIGLLPVVLVSPGDTALIHESGEERRKLLNSLLSQIDREYLQQVVRYNHLLQERNRMLKLPGGGGFAEVMEVVDMQLAELGGAIYHKRAALVQRLGPLVGEYYGLLSSEREEVSLSYRSELADTDFAQLLASSRERDRACGFTTSGIHRDDLRLEISGYPVRKYGSQGQQKSLLLALKLAQFDVMRDSKAGLRPILLLDDVFDKLDLLRVEQLIALVSSERFGQIFITDSNKVRLGGILERMTDSYKLFEVQDGTITPHR